MLIYIEAKILLKSHQLLLLEDEGTCRGINMREPKADVAYLAWKPKYVIPSANVKKKKHSLCNNIYQ